MLICSWIPEFSKSTSKSTFGLIIPSKNEAKCRKYNFTKHDMELLQKVYERRM